jgi:hypothetical protein
MKNFDLEKRLSLGHQVTHSRDHLTPILFGKPQLKIVKTLMILPNALMTKRTIDNRIKNNSTAFSLHPITARITHIT